MKRYATFQDMLSWHPCLADSAEGRARMKRVAGKRKRWYPKHVAALLGAPGFDDDQWEWVAVRYLLKTGRKQVLVAWGRICFRSAKRIGGPKNERLKWAENALRDLESKYSSPDDAAESLHHQAALLSKQPYTKAARRLYQRLAKLMTEAS